MAQIIRPEARGLFAFAEGYLSDPHPVVRSQMHMFAAQIALRQGLVVTDLPKQASTLADVEVLLRHMSSKAYFVAAPLDHVESKPPTTYSWLTRRQRQRIPPPEYTLFVAIGEEERQKTYIEAGVDTATNTELLVRTGLPRIMLSETVQGNLLKTLEVERQ